MKSQNMSIKKKLLSSFILISLIGGLASVMSLLLLHKTTKDYNYALEHYGFSQGDIGKLCIEIQTSNTLVRDLMLLKDYNSLKASENKLNQSLLAIDGQLSIVEKTISTNEEKTIFTSITQNLSNYQNIRSRVLLFGIAERIDEGVEILNSEGSSLMDSITSDTNKLLQLKIDTCNTLAQKLNILKILTITVISISMIVLFILTSMFAKRIVKSISEPLDKIGQVADEIANGNLDVSLDSNSYSEINKLTQSFSNMLSQLKDYINEISTILGSVSNGNLSITTSNNYKGSFVEIKYSLDEIIKSLVVMFGNIKETSYNVTAGAELLSSSSKSLAEGANYQSNSIHQLLSSIDEINKKVQNTATNANDTASITKSLIHDIKNSEEKMQEMLLAINEIEKSSKDINNIISVIDEIADQTNLLALNASIEAARAGEAGRGFAVVADEVSNLSVQSAYAVNQTTSLINESIKSVNNGRELADKTTTALLKVIEHVKDASNSINNIVLETNNQAKSIEEIKEHIVSISDVVQSNTATAEENAAASEELNSQSENLDQILLRFNL